MAMLRIRLTGSDDTARAIMNLLQSLDGIEHVEEISDLMPHMDDPDSSSAGLSDDAGPHTHEIEIEVPNPSTERKVREAQLAKVPYILVVGEKEVQAGGANVRLRNGDNMGLKSVAEIAALIRTDAEEPFKQGGMRYSFA